MESRPKPLIVCVIGPSGVGKTHMVSYMHDKYDIPMIESRTTRKPRYPGEVGHTFETEAEFQKHDERDMIAYTSWPQEDGSIARYCCLKQDVPLDTSFYVIDEYGMKYLKSHFSDDFTIFAVRMFATEQELNNRVSIERRKRDEGKFTLPAEAYDYIIENDYSDTMTDKYDRLYQRIKSL